jgi:magnesium-transporting ATPase (P-type)
MNMTVNNEWYQKTVSEVMQSLVTEDSGLTSDEAKARLVRYGYNELKFKQRGVLVRFLLQFNSALIYVLLVAAAVTAILGMWIDSSYPGSGSCQRHNWLYSRR